MTPKVSRGLTAAGLAALLASASVSFAQPAPPTQPPMRDHGPGMERPDPAAMAARRAERLRAALQLRPDQEPALRTFLDTMRPPEGAREAWRRDRQETAQLTTPQRLDRMKARMAERQARFDKRAAATIRFYAQLSPAQQKAFDTLAPMEWGGGKGGRHGPGMGGWDHGGGMDHQPG